MLKRIYSKRSGFTLVEIIVAFAVFVIMAAMIIQILELAIKARNSNTIYAQELARQERMLTVIEKDSSDYNTTDKTGEYLFTLDGKEYRMGYQVKATDPAATNQEEGINYFLSPIDYKADNSGTPTPGEGSPSSTDGMSQASRMDTRITGTSGIGFIKVKQVIKDTFAYPADSPFKIPDGHTRYWIEISASDKNEAGNVTLQEEDVPYSQFRMYFLSDEKDAGKGAAEYTDSDGKKYKKDVYKEARIVDLGHINTSMDGSATSVQKKGLTTENTSDGNTASTNNLYLVQMSGTNGVRIGTPFEGTGTRFQKSKYIRFYVEFEGDPHLTAKSFGANGVENADGSVTYAACPQYAETFNADGTPKYETPTAGAVHPSIYGAFIPTRHYVTTTTP